MRGHPGLPTLLDLRTKYVGITAAGILTGVLFTHSITTTPLLLASSNHEIILTQFRHLQIHSRRKISILTAVSSLAFFASSFFRFRQGLPFLRYLFSGLFITGIIPYQFLAMRKTESQLQRLYEEEVEGMGFEMKSKEQEVVVKGEVRGLVDWWGVVNLGRVVSAGVGFIVGITSFL